MGGVRWGVKGVKGGEGGVKVGVFRFLGGWGKMVGL